MTHLVMPRYYRPLSPRGSFWSPGAPMLMVRSPSVEPPFGLRLLLPFWCRRGGVLVHGWCAEKENRGKGGSGKGKIGAGVGSCQSMDPVRIPSGPSRAPIFAFLGTAFGQSGSSRDPVGIQSGSSRAPMSGGSQIHKK